MRADEYDLEMVNVDDVPAYSSDEDDEYDTTDSEYGEGSSHHRQSMKRRPPASATKSNSSVAKTDFFRKSIRRQNICFGSSVLLLVGVFIAAYSYMDLSFSPTNVGIFGDEVAMKGSSGEVGLDADNAETQQIIDEEIIELEETGHWGDNANAKTSKLDEVIFDKAKIGEHKWVEESNWWKDNIGNMDISNMTKKEVKAYEKMKKKEQREEHKRKKEEEKRAKAAKKGNNIKEGQLEDIDAIKDKLANLHHDSYQAGKENKNNALDDIYRMKQKHNGERPDDWSRGKNKNKKGDKQQHDGGDDNNATQLPEDRTRNHVDGNTVPIPEEETGVAEETNEQLEKAEQVNEEESTDAKTISKSYTVLEQVSHDKQSFTQGISYCSDGKIYETTGLYGQSKVRRINPDNFEVEYSVNTPKKFFGEGSTCFVGPDGQERLVEITWQEQKGFVYDVPSLELVHSFDYTTTSPGNQGWGITYDSKNHELIVSDGSKFLYFWDPDNFQTKRKVEVTRFDGRPQDQINELEFMDGLVCYNIWHQDEIICADPATGKSVREYDFSEIWPRNQRGSSENVLNGIALGKDYVLITGKRWDRIYKVVFDDWPTLLNNDNN